MPKQVKKPLAKRKLCATLGFLLAWVCRIIQETLMLFDQDLGNVPTSVAELSRTTPAGVQHREDPDDRINGSVRLFVKTGGQAEEIGGTLRVELSPLPVTTEVTVKETDPVVGEAFTTVEASVELAF
jgi:hypothetical protein